LPSDYLAPNPDNVIKLILELVRLYKISHVYNNIVNMVKQREAIK